ncbi:hypothetical protein ACWDRZ_18305 [Streptomyces sp. NPDC003509]
MGGLMVPDRSTCVRFTVGTARLLVRGVLWGVTATLIALSTWTIRLIAMGGGGARIAAWAAALVVPGALFTLVARYQRGRTRADHSRNVHFSAVSGAEREKAASSPPGTG